MEKRIKPYAIVPSPLYVRREADLQLRQIIADMGRPGYVLVSRQMGKTNLLLNAKREVDSPEDCFVYLDVSNAFSDLRSFFRNIIDTALDNDRIDLVNIVVEISKARISTEAMQPHKEHERELRAILKAIPGKLVICLDEIDALTKVDYSDNVFSLIRSIYFSGRTNFPEFYRLTYVLSGVADPSELIKNKAISPFNIGEKIYLNDFSLKETLVFLQQCSLNLPIEAVQRVYYWASGNPRVTWDICSALETQIIGGKNIGEEAVDYVVEDLYLKNFDLPPIDHIRTRVELDKEIRSAVMSIHYDKTLSLSDKVKDRLYLAGISTPKALDGSIAFRNRIMAVSLSEKWIADVEARSTTLEDRASDKLRLKQYQEAIDLYTEFLGTDDNPERGRAALLNIGFCQAMLENFDEAIATFTPIQLDFDKTPYLYNFRGYWLGISYLCKDEHNLAKIEFVKICDQGSTEHSVAFYFQSLVNLAICHFKGLSSGLDGKSESGDLVEKLLFGVIDSIDQVKKQNPLPVARQILFSAYYHLALYYMSIENSTGAMHSLDEAVVYAEEGAKLNLMIYRASFQKDSKVEASIYSQCVDELIEMDICLAKSKQINPSAVTVDECANLIYRLTKLGVEQSVLKLINYLDSTKEKQIVTCWNIFLQATLMALTEGDVVAFDRLTRYRLMTVTEETPKDEVLQTLSLAIILPGGAEKTELVDKFVDLFLVLENYILRDADVRVIWDVVFSKIRSGNAKDAARLYEAAKASFERAQVQSGVSEEVRVSGSAVFEYLRLKVYKVDREEVRRACETTVLGEILSAPHRFELPFFPAEFVGQIKEDILSLVGSARTPRKFQKVGRNEIVEVVYADGRTVKGKYKKFISLIESGHVSLLLD